MVVLVYKENRNINKFYNNLTWIHRCAFNLKIINYDKPKTTSYQRHK